MPDYKEMYFKIARAAADAVDILIAAQRECEEMYIADDEAPEFFCLQIGNVGNEQKNYGMNWNQNTPPAD